MDRQEEGADHVNSVELSEHSWKAFLMLGCTRVCWPQCKFGLFYARKVMPL